MADVGTCLIILNSAMWCSFLQTGVDHRCYVFIKYILEFYSKLIIVKIIINMETTYIHVYNYKCICNGGC